MRPIQQLYLSGTEWTSVVTAMEYMHMWHLSVHRQSKNKSIHFPGSYNIVNSYIDFAWNARTADKALWAFCPKLWRYCSCYPTIKVLPSRAVFSAITKSR